MDPKERCKAWHRAYHKWSGVVDSLEDETLSSEESRTRTLQYLSLDCGYCDMYCTFDESSVDNWDEVEVGDNECEKCPLAGELCHNNPGSQPELPIFWKLWKLWNLWNRMYPSSPEPLRTLQRSTVLKYSKMILAKIVEGKEAHCGKGEKE